MSDERYADRAARLLRESRARIVPQRSLPHEAAIDSVSDAIRAVASRRRRKRLLVSVVAASTIFAGALGMFAVVHGRSVAKPTITVASGRSAEHVFFVVGDAPVTLVGPGGERRQLGRGDRWRPGDRLRSDSDVVDLDGGDGTVVRMTTRSELQLVRADAERWLRLIAGGVSIHVAKLQPGERFVLLTADAEVEVRGTRFQVQYSDDGDGCGTVTHVRVEEGIVSVRSAGTESRVPGGGRWPTSCVPAPAAGVTPPVVPPAGRMRGRLASVPSVAATPARPVAAEAARTSTLAAENDLFGSALGAEHDGRWREAIELLDVLMRRFPDTPLRASAIAARDRLSQIRP